MTAIPQPAAPTSAFAATYDAWNRLVALAGVASYSYDGLNRRATKLVSGVLRDIYYSSQWQILEERVGGGAAADRQFVWGLRYIDDLVLRDRSTERLYALQDANWNVTSVVNNSGAVQERYSYTAYGLPTFLNPDFAPLTASVYAWETLYCGYRWDSESELYLARNRYLDSLLGVWITRDPIGFESRDSNLYRYVFNRPKFVTDPDGLAGIYYGNYCGPNSPAGPPVGPPPIDALDSCCLDHDNCYGAAGATATSACPGFKTPATRRCDATLKACAKGVNCAVTASPKWCSTYRQGIFAIF